MKAFAGKTQYYQEGMDLRDYFAAKVMEAYLNKTIISYQHNDGIEIRLPTNYLIGEAAYQIADAMMKAREPENDSHEVMATALMKKKEVV